MERKSAPEKNEGVHTWIIHRNATYIIKTQI